MSGLGATLTLLIWKLATIRHLTCCTRDALALSSCRLTNILSTRDHHNRAQVDANLPFLEP